MFVCGLVADITHLYDADSGPDRFVTRVFNSEERLDAGPPVAARRNGRRTHALDLIARCRYFRQQLLPLGIV